jgi:ribosomal protein L11 methyltransferase
MIRLAGRDWRHSWKRHFRPISIGTRLLLRPSWSRRRAKPGQAVVVLDPGLSFGTGQHPTTSFCLRELVRLRRAVVRQSFLDLGTGSGILAIAAAKLGYAPIGALDNDPECVRVTRRNAARNRVADRLEVRQADVTRLPRRPPARPRDVVCANLLAPLLIETAPAIMAQVRPGGFLVVAGILKREFGDVARALEAVGGVLAAERIEGDWHSASYHFPT